jgi:hypothetical protein
MGDSEVLSLIEWKSVTRLPQTTHMYNDDSIGPFKNGI